MVQVAEKLGVSLGAYQKYENGSRDVSTEMLCKIADLYNVTTDYLLGRAPQTDPIQLLMAQNVLTPQEIEEQFSALPEDLQAIVLALIKAMKARREQMQQSRPSIQMRKHLNKAAAGFGYDLSSEDEWAEITVLDTPQARSADFAVEVDGDSMEPDYHSGDIVLVKRDPDVSVGEVGLFVHDGMGYIKERGKKCLISRNPDYPDIEGEARCIGLVIGIAETV
jgi:phage repressor protein C with HTH and peptisase S24 domain